MPRSLLITGGAGFIGSAFVRHWRESHPGDAIVVLDALTYAGDLANLEGVADLAFAHGDIRDGALVSTLLADHGVDTIVHFAAESHVDRSIDTPELIIDVNVVGTHTLLKAARAHWLAPGAAVPHRFHHVSTDEVFGSLAPDDPPATEATAYAPNSPYAASKAASDQLVRAYNRTYGLSTTISNCSNNFGPRQYPEKLIPLCLRNILQGLPLPVYGDGLNIRDWLYVEDHCAGIARILEAGRPGESYNLGGGVELTNLRLLDALCAIIDHRFAADPTLALRHPAAPPARGIPSASLISFVPDRPGHDRRYALNDAKARRELGYRPEVPFGRAMELTADWCLVRAVTGPNDGGRQGR